MSLLIINQSDIRVPRSYLEQAFGEACKYLKRKKIISKPIKELTIVFMNSSPAQKINYKFRKKNYATDVLSFESKDPESYGELIFCSQVIKKQSVQHDLTFRDEIVYMLYHGLLHLLGFEHEGQPTKARKMFKIQDEMFELFLNKTD